ncbi:MAG: hypothetical protein ACHQU1_12320 [Gemmatimonadales bacterium]
MDVALIRAAWVRSLLVTVLLGFSAAAGAEQREFDMTVRGGELPKEKQVIRVQQGDEVTLRWTTDAPLTIHLHGYDIEKALSPDRPVSMQLRARAAGRFPIEIHPQGHGRERTLGYLEVHPR